MISTTYLRQKRDWLASEMKRWTQTDGSIMLQLPGVLRIELPRFPDYQRLAMQQPTSCVLLGWKRAYYFNPLPGLVADQLRRRAVFLRGQQGRSFGLLANQRQPQPRKSPKKPRKVGATAAATHQQAGRMAQAKPPNPNICGKTPLSGGEFLMKTRKVCS